MTSSYSPSNRSKALAVRNDLSPFGNKLIESGYVDREQMQQALVETRQSGRHLLEILEEITGQELSPDLQRQYKNQRLFELKVLYGLNCLDPEVDSINDYQMGELMENLLPIDLCRRYQLLPLQKPENESPSLLVAMVNPDNLEAQDELKRLLRSQGLELKRWVVAPEDYQQIIDKYLDEQVRREEEKL